MATMNVVALEWISSSEIVSQNVMQFVQQLVRVPEDSICEINNISSRKWRTSSRSGVSWPNNRIQNEVHLTCESKVAEFLCETFRLTSEQTQYVTGGEVVHIKCKRVYPGGTPLGKKTEVVSATLLNNRGQNADNTLPFPIYNTSSRDGEEQAIVLDSQVPRARGSTVPILPIENVITLIEILGDQVLAAHEAYELFADADVRSPQRMTMLGLSKALTRLCSAGFNKPKVTIKSLHLLLSKLVTSNSVAVRRIPSSTTMPFISYTDFLACYVAYLTR